MNYSLWWKSLLTSGFWKKKSSEFYEKSWQSNATFISTMIVETAGVVCQNILDFRDILDGLPLTRNHDQMQGATTSRLSHWIQSNVISPNFEEGQSSYFHKLTCDPFTNRKGVSKKNKARMKIMFHFQRSYFTSQSSRSLWQS